MCNNSCNECSRKVYVNEVSFADNTLILTLPDTTTYSKQGKYCFVITTAIPNTVTRNSPVVAVIGAGTTQFPLLTRCGAAVLEQQLRSRQRYLFRVATSAAGGSLVLLGTLPCVENTTLPALNDATGGGT